MFCNQEYTKGYQELISPRPRNWKKTATAALASLAAALLLSVPVVKPAAAAGTSATMGVAAAVGAGCAIIATDLNFGDMAYLHDGNWESGFATGSFDISCTSPDLLLTVDIDRGQNTISNSIVGNAMVGPNGSRLAYYVSATAPDGSRSWVGEGFSILFTGTFIGYPTDFSNLVLEAKAHTQYGYNVQAGPHSDVITVTVSY